LAGKNVSRNKVVVDCRLRPGAATWRVILSARPFRVAIYAETLCAKMTSSMKPEVLNVSRRPQRRTEPRPYITSLKISEDRARSSGDRLADRQTDTNTDKHTDTQITVLRQSYRGRSNNIVLCRWDVSSRDSTARAIRPTAGPAAVRILRADTGVNVGTPVCAL